jgi:hypothetical protein
LLAGGEEVTRLTLVNDIRRYRCRRNLVGSSQITAISKPRESKSLVVRKRVLQMIEQRPQVCGRNTRALQSMQAQVIEARLEVDGVPSTIDASNSRGSAWTDRSDCASQARSDLSSRRPPRTGGNTTTAEFLSYDAFTMWRRWYGMQY